jgi:hypothetical protein
MADEKKDDITAFAKARLQDPSPRKARRQGRHRNSHSTTAVPELWLRVSERRADHFEEDCEVEGDDWYFSGPYSAESSSLRAEAERSPRLDFGGRPSPGYHALLYGALRDGSASPMTPHTIVRVSRRRWLMLAYLSLLALLSDWICFSAAPIAPLVRRNFRVHDAHLVTCFLATNVIFCLLEPSVVKVCGLRVAVVGGALAMALGCLLRSAAAEVAVYEQAYLSDDDDSLSLDMAPGYLVVAGTMLVGAAQPFFQCTPSLLAANWFGESETTLAATLALNSNQLGIALAYAVGAGLVRTDADLALYFRGLALFGCLLFIGCAAHFRSLPKKAPSLAQMAALKRAKDLEERRRCFDALRRAELGGTPKIVPEKTSSSNLSLLERRVYGKPITHWLVHGRQLGHGALDLGTDLLRSSLRLWSSSGFRGCLIAFVSSIASTNLFSAFLPHLVYEGEGSAVDLGLVAPQKSRHQATRVAALGSAFQVAILLGSLTFGGYVDWSKRYKTATGLAMVGTVIALLFIGDGAVVRQRLDCAVLLLGCLAGPVQPLAAELAVEVTYPDGDENTIVALMQTAGNGISALAVPAFLALQRFYRARTTDYQLRVEYLVLALLNALATGYFLCRVYGEPLKRCAANQSRPTSRATTPVENGVGDTPTADLRGRRPSVDFLPIASNQRGVSDGYGSTQKMSL